MGVKTKVKVNSLHIVLLVSVFALLAFYIFLVNSIVGDGLAMKSMENRIDEIKKENDRLELYATEAQSLSNLEERSRLLNLEEVKRPAYIKIKAGEPLVLGN